MIEFAKKYLSHSSEITVALDELDFLERLKPAAALQYFQDLATVHADEIGIGFEEMSARNMLWVLSKLSVKYYRSPKVGEKITVTTFPRKPSMAYALRDYYVTDKDENVIMSGSSKWLVIDKDNHMIRRCSPLFSYSDEVYFPNDPFENANKTVSDARDTEMRLAMSDMVRLTDIDRNRHMNNARYGDMLLNVFTPEYLKTHEIERFDLNFLNELKFGDKYDVYCVTDDSFAEIRAERGGESMFRAEIKWKTNA
ncbi:MAG: hypothetical protein HFK09_01250 [Clostridia bacterium]|nr:hypothetical protein [Clostridia bacterium]